MERRKIRETAKLGVENQKRQPTVEFIRENTTFASLLII